MKSHSIEWLHAKLHKQIKLVASYLEIPEMEFIIKACRLKPHEYLFGEGRILPIIEPVILRKWWVDEFANSLIIQKKKHIQLTYNDLRLDQKKIICTDLYHGLSPNKTAKMSKLVHLIVGKDEDLHEDCCLLTFLCIDNHLRSFLCLYGTWHTVSPLLLGLENLKQIAKHQGITYFRQLDNEKDCPIPCLSQRTCVSCVPVGSGLLDELKRNHEWLLPIFEE